MKKIAIIGDSVTFGYDGQKNGPPIIAQTLASLANLEYVNLSIGGVSFGDSNGISGQVNRVNFKDFDYVLIDMGVNDYRFPHETIGNMQSALQSGIDKIKADNADTQIFLVTPLQSWENGNGSLSQKNSMGFSQNDIDDMITRIARLNGLKYVDWRENPIVTEANHKQTLGDGTVHPTAETQRLMAQRFFQVFFDSQPVNDDSGHHNSDSHDNGNQGNQDDHHTDVPPAPTQITLVQLSRDRNVLDDFNSNVATITNALQEDVDEVSWVKQTFPTFNRACWRYLIDTMVMLIDLVNDASSDTTYLDDDGNELDNDTLINPKTVHDLRLDAMLDVLNHDFKYFEKLVNEMLM